MMRELLFKLVLLVVVSITLSSCSQTRLNKLEGQWQLFWINDMTDPNLYIWEFEGGELTVTIYEPPNGPIPIPPRIGGVAQYKTSAEFLDAVVEVTGYEMSISDAFVNAQLHNGDWVISKIDDDVMRLAHRPDAGGYEIREFTRVQ